MCRFGTLPDLIVIADMDQIEHEALRELIVRVNEVRTN